MRKLFKERKLIKGGNYMRKYSKQNFSFLKKALFHLQSLNFFFLFKYHMSVAPVK